MFDFFKKKDPAPATAPAAPTTPVAEPARPSWTDRLKAGLARTRETLNTPISELFTGGKIDEALYEELESMLLMADCGVSATTELLEDVRGQVSRSSLKDASELRGALRQAMTHLLTPLAKPLDTTRQQPFVIMLAGVNGAGKTTTIGKLAWKLQAEGKSVLIAAGDTFRAAAREQLQAWGERNNVHVVAQEGGDPAAVIFDAVNSAKAKGIDVVIADTAGRLPTQLNLMEEIKKIQRVIGKALPDAPHEVLLVLDSTTGQNAVMQVKAFDDALKVTGLVLTKLDGTAKGGVIAAIAKTRPIPVRFIGVGEQIDDLQPFDAAEFSEALFS
ncbi:fused signal recognition particle receptor [Novimethylophilus kurashikiensis]|uniref:Signal recognition particle receptor FtsY n=1 Tax=Novimethylophilus kurashikiensis TaxID=1825523 RepID=A0A2R5FCK8_9PROT|nr:signal recognition particle-docking protein FtsY [Novimethylophilus kurashikiensis]GBG15589.1 fused signal recognition particle receptor [Novimethylophilus kurashikiensis]